MARWYLHDPQRLHPPANSHRPVLTLYLMADAQDRLTLALMTFLDDALALRGSVADDGTSIKPVPDVEAFAAQLAALPSVAAVAHTAIEVAQDNGRVIQNFL